MQVEFRRFSHQALDSLYIYRCNARIFTLLPAFPATMAVEVMLLLRVLALCEVNNNFRVYCSFITCRWKLYSKATILISMFDQMVMNANHFRSVGDSVWLVTSSSSLLVCLIRNCQIKILFLASSFSVQVIAYLVLACVILTKARSQWCRPTASWLWHWLLFFRSVKGIAGREVFTGCLLSLPHWYYLTWTLLLVVECELRLILTSVEILQLFAFVRHSCNSVCLQV